MLKERYLSLYLYENIVGTPNEFTKTIDCLKKEFAMKDLGSTKFCLRLQIEYLNTSFFVHIKVYIMKVLKRFYMDLYHFCTSIVRLLNVDKCPFKPRNDKELLSQEIPYFIVIRALIYFAYYTRLDIVFAVNLLSNI